MRALHPLLAELVQRAAAAAKGTEARLEALSEREAALEALRIVRKAGLVAFMVPERDGGADAGGLCAPATVVVGPVVDLSFALSAGSSGDQDGDHRFTRYETSNSTSA